jgi:GNAT superfamily N-acetyltransferase
VTVQLLHRISSIDDRPAAIATLAEAFRSDPICRWVWPAEATYDRFFPPFVEAFAGAAFHQGTAFATDDAGGVALWLPPGIASDEEALGQILVDSVAEERQEEVFAFLGIQGELHPHEPLWYLPLIGASVQGRGYGSSLLEHSLGAVDATGLPAYLEATSPRNRALYERHGFEVVEVIQHGSSPEMWAMYRKAR